MGIEFSVRSTLSLNLWCERVDYLIYECDA